MTTFRSDPDLFLGCLILANVRKDEWFAQIVRKDGEGLLGFKVEASAMAIGKDEVLRKVCDYAEIDAVPPPAVFSHTKRPVGVHHGGLTTTMLKCETAVGDLARLLGSLRRLHVALGDLVEVMENG